MSSDAPQKPKPIVISVDGKDSFWCYPEDNIFRQVKDLPRNGSGVVNVAPELLSAALGWWYDKAEARVREQIERLALPPVEELGVQGDEPAEVLTQRLAMVSYWQSKVLRELSAVDVKLSLAKDALEHAVGRALALQEDKGPLGPRSALIISTNHTLRQSKIELMESSALERGLRRRLEELDLLWRTCSRVISARLSEPSE